MHKPKVKSVMTTMHEHKVTSVFAVSLLVASCGGSSDSGGSLATEDESNNNVLVEGDNSISNELALDLLAGKWLGTLTSYLEGTDTKQCEWDVTLNLESRQVSGSGAVTGGTFYGDVSAELLYAFGEESEECVSDSFELDWSALCYSGWYKEYVPTPFLTADYTCLHDYDRLDGHNTDLVKYDTLESILNQSKLSYDETTIKLDRRNRDDTEMSLQKNL